MPLTLSTDSLPDDALQITLSGELDASTVGEFQTALEAAAGQRPKHLVLNVADLTFMASAGIRALIFAKQKMGAGVKVYLIAPQEPIRQTITRTGMQHSLVIQDAFAPVA